MKVFSFSQLYILLFFYSFVFSQGEILKRGEQGLEGKIGLFANTETSGYRVEMGYSFLGIIDAEILYTKGGAGILKNGILSPGIVWYIVKEEDAPRAPTLGLSLGYNRYKSTETTTTIVPDGPVTYKTIVQVKEATYNFLAGMCTAYRSIGSWRRMDIDPFIGVGYAVSSSGWKFIWKSGFSILTKLQPQASIIFRPAIEREPNLTTLVFSIGMLF